MLWPRSAWGHQSLEGAGRTVSWRFQREGDPAYTVILDFWPQNCGRRHSCCFKPPNVW